jgi:hypothetical protein
MKTRPLSRLRHALLAGLALGAACAHGAGTFLPSDQPFGDVPQLAITGFNLSTGAEKAFQVYFDPVSWAGDVSAYPVGTDGKTQIASKLWSAADIFGAKQACFASTPAPASLTFYDTGRNIVTRDGTTNIPFRWTGGLSDAQKTSINADISAGGLGDKIHRYIRGDRINEKYQQVLADDGVTTTSCGIATGIFRPRVSILGDIIHARPLFVGAPPANFTFDSYQTFKANNATRPPRLFVGSNDGMVHGFDADDGKELWAYIPSMLIGNLKNLSVSPYTHAYFIDGQMTAGDVNFGTTASPDWRTIIVGGLGAGGKGLYALDVTDADAADETEAKAKILWEITSSSTGYADLGYTYGTPVIARMNTGQWAVIVNNGYLNTNTGQAVLYIIDIKTGALIKTLSTSSGAVATPNGLSSAVAVDTSFDGKVDRIYAGDIDGNLWKFDVSATTASSWAAPTKLFPTSTDISNGITAQAIIGAPDVVAHPITGFLVYFATGRMLTGGTSSDATDSTVQNYAYAVWDGAPSANTTFLNQTLTERAYGSIRTRYSSGLSVNWNDPGTVPAPKVMHKGWRTALPAGERVIGTGFVRDARYQFTSVNPTIAHTPTPNGDNWLLELDFLTGGAVDKPTFDLDKNSLLNDADRLKYITGDTLPSGKSVGDPVVGPTGIPVALYMGAGLISQPLLANVSAQLATTLFNDNPYTSPADQPAVPPAPPTIRGVSGGHFDVEIYYKNSGGQICNYQTSSGSAATSAVGWIDFTYGGNKSANSTTGPVRTFSIKVDGVELLTATNPGSKSRSNLEDWISTHVTAAISANWDVTSTSSGSPSGNNAIKISAKVAGTAMNGKTIVVTVGGGMSTSDFTVTTPTAGGAAAVPGVTTFDDNGIDPKACYYKLHVHEYDDVYNVTGVNMLNASTTSLNLSRAITSTSTPFKVIVSNQYLSPAVTLSLGGAPHVSVRTFNTAGTLDVATLPTYTRANVGTFEYNMPTDAFTPKNWWAAAGTGTTASACTGSTPNDCRSGLHPTQYSCATQANHNEGGRMYQPVIPPALGTDGPGTRGNTTNGTAAWGPGDPVTTSKGVRHNGALTFQVIKDTTPNSALELSVPGVPEYGWRVKEADFETYVLAEYSTFWHHVMVGSEMVPPQSTPSDSNKCYHSSGWKKEATLDTTPPDTSVFKTPAAGSADPGAGTARATVASTSSTTSTSGGVTTTTTTTNYSNGGTLVTTQVTDASGNTTTTSQYTPPPGCVNNCGGGGGSSAPVVDRGATNAITGYQQTRSSGKLGRVTWHELLRQ